MDPVFISLLKPISWFIFGGMAVFSAIVGLVLAYHWSRYAMNAGMSLASMIVFAGGAVILLLILLAATIAINIS